MRSARPPHGFPAGQVLRILALGGLGIQRLAAMDADAATPLKAPLPTGARSSVPPDTDGKGTDQTRALDPGFLAWFRQQWKAAAELENRPVFENDLRIDFWNPSPSAGSKRPGAFKISKGQRLDQAALMRALGGPIGEPDLHPFLSVRGDEAEGEVRLLLTSDPDGTASGAIRELSASGIDCLFWVTEGEDRVESLARHSEFFMGFQSSLKVRHFRIDGAGHVWMLGDGWVRCADMDGSALPTRGRLCSGELPRPLGERSATPATSDKGDLFLAFPQDVLHIRLDPGDGAAPPSLRGELLPGSEETWGAQVMSDREGNALVFAHPDRPFLYVRKLGDMVGTRFPTASGGSPVCLAQGPGGEVWFMQVRPLGFGCFDTRTQALTYLPVPEAQASAILDPCALAVRQDGDLWFTDREGCRVGRITRAGALTTFDLGKGQQPEEIIAPQGPWVFVTLKGKPAIASIRAVAARPEEACGRFVPRDDPDSLEGGADGVRRASLSDLAVRPGPEGPVPGARKGRSGAQRRRVRTERELADAPVSLEAGDRLPAPGLETKATASGLAAPVPAPVPPLPPAVEPAPAPWEETKAPAARRASEPPPRPGRTRTPRQRLAAMGLQVEDWAIRHILERHGAESKADASLFAARFSSEESLLKLMADALTHAEIGREMRADRRGQLYTTCRCPGVGVSNGRSTDTFLVRTRLGWDALTRTWHHVLVTAHPE